MIIAFTLLIGGSLVGGGYWIKNNNSSQDEIAAGEGVEESGPDKDIEEESDAGDADTSVETIPEEPNETPIDSEGATPEESPTPSITEVGRVEKIEETKEIIPYDVVKKDDSSIEKGKTVVSQKGNNGEVAISYKVIYENNKEISRVEVSRKIVRAATNEIVSVGTKTVAVAPKPTPTVPKPTNPTPAPSKPEPTPTPSPTPKPVVTTKEDIKTETIKFSTETKYDNTLEEGKERVERAGVNGTRTIVYTVTLTDGKETGRVVKSDTKVEAINEIIAIGTKKAETFDDKMAKQLPSGFTRGVEGPGTWPYIGNFVIYKGSTPVAYVTTRKVTVSADLSFSELESLAAFWIKYREGSGLTVNNKHVFESIDEYKNGAPICQVGEITISSDGSTVVVSHQGF